jgi:translation initiation factor 2B subunit (eIF-2B alpha/beta/delta family)
MDNIDMVFFGALTLKDTMDFVMEPGTHGVASEFYAENVPMYMFIDTSKFSLWKSKQRGEIFIHKHTRTHCSKPIEYERIKYSHDRVPAKIFSKIVTNEGIFDADGVKDLFEKRLKQVNSN